MQTKDGFRITGWQAFQGTSGDMVYIVHLINGFDHGTRETYNVMGKNGEIRATLPF